MQAAPGTVGCRFSRRGCIAIEAVSSGHEDAYAVRREVVPEARFAPFRPPLMSSFGPPMHIIGPELHREAECEAILRTLPKWFGIEPALHMYARDSGLMPTFAVVGTGGRIVAFLTLQEHFPTAWEIHCIAVEAEARSIGLGSRLLAHAEAWLGAQGVKFLQVKTVASTSTSAAYAQTREFYARRGFTPLEVFPTLWDAHNPALQSVKVLDVV